MKKEGGTYGVSAFGSLTKYPKEKAVLQIYFDTDPAKRAKMTDIILNELNQFVDQGTVCRKFEQGKRIHAEEIQGKCQRKQLLGKYTG